MTTGRPISILFVLAVFAGQHSQLHAQCESDLCAPQVWQMPLGYFDPYATAPGTILPPPWSPSTRDKSLTETLFTPYIDVNGNRRSFPLAASLALDRGYELPLPFGVSPTYTYLTVNPRVKDVRVGFAGGPTSSVPVSVDNLENEVHNVILRLDGWILPFLNVYGLFGETSLSSFGDLTVPNPLPIGPDITVPIRVDTNGPLYGVGAVLAVGYESWFLAVDTNFTRTDLSLFDSTIENTSVGIRTGFRTDISSMKAVFWLGTMYVDRHTFLEGTVLSGTALDPIKYEVLSTFDKPWNFLVGSQLEVSSSFNLMFEFGFGDREQVTAAASYRF